MCWGEGGGSPSPSPGHSPPPQPPAPAVSQGVDEGPDGLKLISDIIRERLGIEMSVLMGANIANEVAEEKFCETTIGDHLARLPEGRAGLGPRMGAPAWGSDAPSLPQLAQPRGDRRLQSLVLPLRCWAVTLKGVGAYRNLAMSSSLAGLPGYRWQPGPHHLAACWEVTLRAPSSSQGAGHRLGAPCSGTSAWLPRAWVPWGPQHKALCSAQRRTSIQAGVETWAQVGGRPAPPAGPAPNLPPPSTPQAPRTQSTGRS